MKRLFADLRTCQEIGGIQIPSRTDHTIMQEQDRIHWSRLVIKINKNKDSMKK